MIVTELTYEELALAEPWRALETHGGRFREKPPMTDSHHVVNNRLTEQFLQQLDHDVYDLRINATRLRRDEKHYHIPDLAVITVPASLPLAERSGRLEIFRVPLPLVVESWSPSTGDYDVRQKLPIYMERGDAEIWLVHPFERTLTAWRRQSDGTNTESVHRSGTIEPIALPGIVIDLDALFA
jgi:Uma2 family endonuclease